MQAITQLFSQVTSNLAGNRTYLCSLFLAVMGMWCGFGCGDWEKAGLVLGNAGAIAGIRAALSRGESIVSIAQLLEPLFSAVFRLKDESRFTLQTKLLDAQHLIQEVKSQIESPSPTQEKG